MASSSVANSEAPFDAVAEAYDRVFTDSAIGQAQRASVWRELGRAFGSGSRILELGCGTGVDACFLAEQGVEVIACDSSAAMIRVAERRVRDRGVGNVELRVLAAENISDLPAQGLLDGAFSNFGALNCLENLSRLAENLARLLRPGATVLLCLMGPFCAWEVLWYLARGEGRKAFRRQRRAGVTARLAPGAFIPVRYPTVGFLARAFAPHFRLIRWKGVGLAVPPSYMESWAAGSPRILEWAVRMDLVLEHCPGIRSLSDHILLKFERTAI
jgi:ubiquinone/menaquinone biosynthesis C-methylase UbiE